MSNDVERRDRLLVVELRMLGDAVMSMPFLRAAARSFELTVCCSTTSAPLAAMAAPLSRIVTWDPPWLAETGKYRLARYLRGNIAALVRCLRATRPHTAVCSWADPRSHLLMALSGAPERIGFPVRQENYLAHNRPWRRRQMRTARVLEGVLSVVTGSPLLTRPVLRQQYRQSHLRDWQQLATALDLEIDMTTPWFTARHSHARSVPASRQTTSWAVHAGGRLQSKRWPLERFQRVVDTFFTPRDIPVTIIQTGSEPAPTPRSSSHRVVTSTSLDVLTGILGEVDAVLCNDSLVSHLAAAMGKRVVAVFGSGEPDWFAPYGNESNVLCSRSCSFHPCMDRCEMPSYVCLESVSAEQVSDMVSRVHSELDSPRQRGAPE